MPYTPDPEQRYDRHLRLAGALTGAAKDELIRKFVDKRVLLTGDAARLSTRGGRLMFRVSANLIARFCPKIDVLLDPSAKNLSAETLDLLHRIDSGNHADFRVVETATGSPYSAVLSIGAPVTRTPNEVTIDATGWLAAISTEGVQAPLPHPSDDNPFGDLLAAALGAAEVFKHLVEPLPGKAFPFGTTTLSAYDYSVGSLDPGPALPASTVLPPTILAGVGAVGNAFLLALANVPNVSGDLFAIDNQSVDDGSNQNRYVLAEERDSDPACPTQKTDLAVRLFEELDLEVHPLPVPLDVALKRVQGGTVPRPRIALSAVDNNQAREDLQKLWPDLLIEGATDSTLAQVSRHEHGSGLGCLLCIHSGPGDSDFSYVAHASGLSGLSEAVIAASMRNASLMVTDADVQAAPETKRHHLAAQVGKPICSVLADLERLSAKPAHELPHQPTVSFVSMIAGTFVAAELVKHLGGLSSELKTFFQLDTMFPLQNTWLQTVTAVPSCYCVQRAGEIIRYRAIVQPEE